MKFLKTQIQKKTFFQIFKKKFGICQECIEIIFNVPKVLQYGSKLTQKNSGWSSIKDIFNVETGLNLALQTFYDIGRLS